jgi:SagB-type dehydrogenase family enzyme
MAETKIIQLPKTKQSSSVSLEEAIAKRRSVRAYLTKDLSLEQIGQLLWSAQGITGQKSGRTLRAAPSAGALYPMEIYALTKDGLFHYLPEGHQLELVSSKDLRPELASACFGQGFVKEVPLDIIICAVYERISARYGERGRRYAEIEAGHIAQNLHLQAVALGLASVPVGAYDDSAVKKALSLPQDQEPIYIIPVGYAK